MDKVRKREDYINWSQYFMGVALIAAKRSKDPTSQVGACIVDQDKKILSTGYNGSPIGYDDDKDMTWELDGGFLDTKYAYVCHAELNAILNAHGKDLRGSTLYVSLFPCNECTKAIIQAGIKEIIYYDDKYNGTEVDIAAKRMLNKCGVLFHKYKHEGKDIIIEL